MIRIWKRKKLRTLTAATAEASIQARPRMSGNIDCAGNSSGLCTFIVIGYGCRADVQKELGCYNYGLSSESPSEDEPVGAADR